MKKYKKKSPDYIGLQVTGTNSLELIEAMGCEYHHHGSELFYKETLLRNGMWLLKVEGRVEVWTNKQVEDMLIKKGTQDVKGIKHVVMAFPDLIVEVEPVKTQEEALTLPDFTLVDDVLLYKNEEAPAYPFYVVHESGVMLLEETQFKDNYLPYLP